MPFGASAFVKTLRFSVPFAASAHWHYACAMNELQAMSAIRTRIAHADARYGPFASTHEAMGVASEEWDEFREAVRFNDLELVLVEALDVAAVMIRLAMELDNSEELRRRSVK